MASIILTKEHTQMRNTIKPYLAMGFYTQRDMAKKLGMSDITFYRFMAGGVFPPPQHQIGKLPRKYYNAADLEIFRKIVGTDW